MILYIYIAPGQGQITPWGQNFDVNRNSLSLCPFVASINKNLFEVWFFTVLYVCFISHVYSPRQGQTTHWGQKIMTTEMPFLFAHILQVSKWSLRNLILCTIFYDFIHVYSPGARAENPLGTNFWCQQKALITSTICCKFQTSLFEFWFYTHFFLMFFHMYIAPDNPLWTKSWCQQKSLVTLPICCKVQNNIFEVWFFT